MIIQTKLNKLIQILKRYPRLNIAVSGGVDSMILSYVAHQISDIEVTAVHACSYAVPEQAFKRIEDYVARYHWQLKLINAGELDDPDYLKNPVNRCYFCKSNLYQRISEETQGVIASGTNLDDLDDFRPGLQAAKEHQVIHPYVEAGITKQDIYQFAALFALTDLESLPAQPCLASRVETGIQIDAGDLVFIDKVESAAKTILSENLDVRCRLTHQGVFLELSKMPAKDLTLALSQQLSLLCEAQQKLFSGIRLYKKGSAFLQDSLFYAAV